MVMCEQLKEMYSDYKSVMSFVNQFSDVIDLPSHCRDFWFGIKPSNNQYHPLLADICDYLITNDFVLDILNLEKQYKRGYFEHNIEQFMVWVDGLRNKKSIYYEMRFPKKQRFESEDYTPEQKLKVIEDEFRKTELSKQYKISANIYVSFIHVTVERVID